MSITGQPAMSLLNSVLIAENIRAEVGAAILDKAKDLETQQSKTVIALLEASGSPDSSAGLNIYA